MSQRAIEKLQSMWADLVLVQVKKVVVREEDLVTTVVREFRDTPDGPVPTGNTTYYKPGEPIPADAKDRAEPHYRKYYGFAGGVFFHSDTNQGLDLDISMTFAPSKWGNHKGDPLPKPGDLICGEVVDSLNGPRFLHWFICPKPVERLIRMVTEGKAPSDAELAELLYCEGHPDKIWAIARLLFHDNVQPFVRMFHENGDPHPCDGKLLPGTLYRCCHSGMWLTMSPDKFVHLMSYILDEPSWWDEFKASCETKPHHQSGDWCEACAHENPEPCGYLGYLDY